MNHHIRFIVLNGPPGSGKTTLAREIVRELKHNAAEGVIIGRDSFAAPMKHFIAAALGEKYDTLKKDQIYPELAGYSPREFLIDLAEQYLKAKYGQDVFGRWLLHRVLRWPARKPSYCVIDDGGFEPETSVLPNVFLIRIYRKGRTFQNDSRGYIEPRSPSQLKEFINDEGMDVLWGTANRIAIMLGERQDH